MFGHKKRRVAWVAVDIVTALALVTACGGGDTGGGGTKKVALRLDFIHTGKDAIWTYGIEKGFFKSAGINLKIEDGKGSATTAQTVANGSDDFGLVDGGTWLAAASKGLPGKAVMSVFASGPLAVLSPSKSPITQPSQMEGKKVAITAGDAPSTLLPALLDRNNVPSGKVQTVNMQPGPKLTALATGGVDAVATTILVKATLAAKDTQVYVMKYSDFGVTTPGWYLVSSNSYLQANSEITTKLLQATQKSIDATLQDPQAAADSFVKQYPEYDKGRALSELQLVLPLIKSRAQQGHPTGWISPEEAKSTLQLLEKFGGIKSSKPATDYLTNEHLEGK